MVEGAWGGWSRDFGSHFLTAVEFSGPAVDAVSPPPIGCLSHKDSVPKQFRDWFIFWFGVCLQVFKVLVVVYFC